jgi:hypothetical protein
MAENETKNNDNTIFDDVFRTMVEKMPELVIPVINEVFHTSYPDDVKILQTRNEHHTKEGTVITDSCLQIENHTYHIECQSTPDSVMVIRMIEYDFYIALEQISVENEKTMIEFPHSCVLYLRHTQNTPDALALEIHMPNGTGIEYTVPIIKVKKYTKDEIFEKNLLFFLPYYIMRYEKEFQKIEEDEERLEDLVSEFKDICNCLEKSLDESRKSELYTDLIQLILRISDYMLRSNKKVKERIDETMGGKVLELESERLIKKGRREGRQEGRVAERKNMISNFLKNGGTKDQAKELLGATGKEIEEILKEEIKSR